MLTGLTKSLFETALETEMTEHLGYDKHNPTGRNGGNSRNGTRTVLTEIGPVQVGVPRDRDGSFEPQLVRKRQRRLTGIDENRAVADRAWADDRGDRCALRRSVRREGV
jgi:transposase-like protein